MFFSIDVFSLVFPFYNTNMLMLKFSSVLIWLTEVYVILKNNKKFKMK